MDNFVESILNIEGTPDLTGLPAIADGGTSVSLQGNYMIMGYEPRSHEFGVMGILDPGFMTGAGQMFYVEEDDLVDWYIEHSEEYGNPEVRALQKAFEAPSVEHPLGPHTGYAIMGDSVEPNNMKGNSEVTSMDKNSEYEHKFEEYKEELRKKGEEKEHGKKSRVELDRSSMPDEHISSAMTPEELEAHIAADLVNKAVPTHGLNPVDPEAEVEALLAGGKGKGWTDVPVKDRPAGWAEEMVETPHGTEYKRIIDPDLKRAESSFEKEANESLHFVNQLKIGPADSDDYAFGVNIVEVPDGFSYEEPNVVPYGEGMVTEPGTGGTILEDFDVSVKSIIIDGVCYSADPNEAAKDGLPYGGNVTPEMLEVVKETVREDEGIIHSIEQSFDEQRY